VERQQTSFQVPSSSLFNWYLANATSLLSIRVAADLDETLALLKATVDKHPGVKLTIDVAHSAIALDADVEGFQTIVVSYFTVFPLPGYRYNIPGRSEFEGRL
jgi:hypothetical protein